MMLRKTDTAKVVQVYGRFIRRYPTPSSLAKANVTTLRKEIRILGIADRARLLNLAARQLVRSHCGVVPKNEEALRKLPGVGRYTANAVLCFAYHKDVPLLDTNVIRVLARVFSVRSKAKRPRDDPELWRFAADLVPKKKPISYNRAVLDLAARVCIHRKPKCSLCPLTSICDYYTTVIRPTLTPAVPD